LRLDKILVVAGFEFRREARKRSIYLVVALMLLPLVAALIVRGIAGRPSVEESERLWAGILGFDPNAAIASASIGVISAVSLASWSWLIATLFGGDLFASDIEDGTASLLLSRDLSRREYVAGKVAALAVTLALSFLVAGIATYAAAWILAGRQEGLVEAAALSPLIGLGSLPLALLAAIVGLKTRRAVLGIILGVIAYFAVAIVAGVIVVYESIVAGDPARAAEATYLVGSALPFSTGSDWPSLIYARIHDITLTIPVPVHTAKGVVETVMVNVELGKFAPHLTVSVLAWSIGLSLLSWYLLEKTDL